jgi:uncharacterized membrane protein YdjX (TVP38/TMEM64 family)
MPAGPVGTGHGETQAGMAQSRQATQGGRALARRWGPLVLLVLVAGLVYATGAYQYLSLAAIAEHRDNLQSFVHRAPACRIAGYGLVYMATVALSIPGAVAAHGAGRVPVRLARRRFAGGRVRGDRRGDDRVSYRAHLAGRCAGAPRRTAAQCAGKGFRDDAFSYLLFLRLVPAFPFWLVNLAPALFNVNLATFVVATLVGIVPGTFAFAFLGSGLDSIIAEQKAAYEACLAAGRSDCEMTFEAGALLTPELIVAFVALGLVALIPVVVRRVRAGGVHNLAWRFHATCA